MPLTTVKAHNYNILLLITMISFTISLRYLKDPKLKHFILCMSHGDHSLFLCLEAIFNDNLSYCISPGLCNKHDTPLIIRIFIMQNLLFVKEIATPNRFGGVGYLGFEKLTFAPIQVLNFFRAHFLWILSTCINSALPMSSYYLELESLSLH